MPRKSSIKKTPPPKSNLQNNTNKPSGGLMGNVAGGIASGFGIGTGIEAARGVGNAIFGSKENTQVNDIKNSNQNNEGCKILSEMISKCKDKNDGFNDCKDLIEMFSNKCLSN